MQKNTNQAPQRRANAIERAGVETLDDAERLSEPRDVTRMLIGANLALSIAVFGWLPIAYGLGFWASLSAAVAGTLVGAVFIAPMALVGHRAATNNSVASGLTFGVLGRLIGSVIGLLLCLGYTALTVWTGGEAIVAAFSRLTGSESGPEIAALAYGLIGLGVTASAIYGYRHLLRLNGAIIGAVGLALALGLPAYWQSFDTAYAGDPEALLLGEFWPTWLLAALTAGVSGPVSYATLLGDWTRYVRPGRSSSSLLWATGIGLTLGLLIPTVFGIASAVATLGDPDRSYVTGLVLDAPAWYVPVLLFAAVVGSFGQAGVNLYSMGLDLDAIFPRLTRLQATILVAAISIGLVYLGAFVWSAETAVTNFVLLLTSFAVPWASLTMLGLRLSRQEIDKDALQVFNRGARGGRYWYWRGWSINATLAWLAGSTAGLMANATESFTGPIAIAAGGIDLSVPLSAAVAAGMFLILEHLNPRAIGAGSGEIK
jgi:purine-cytosine permease-like protein